MTEPERVMMVERLANIEAKVDRLVAMLDRLSPLIAYAEQKFGSRRSFRKDATR
jgi:hypothetical protein